LWIILSDDTSVAGWALYGRGIAPPEPAIDVLQGPHFARSHEAAVRRLLRIFDVLLLSCAAAGLILLFLRAKRSRSLVDRALAVGMLTAIAYVPILSAAIAVNGRYRWPSEDLSIPLAALFIASRRDRALERSGQERETPGT